MSAQIPDTRPGFYYVTVQRSNSNASADYRRLRGPFVNDHAGALGAVQEAQRKACDLDPRAHWYAFGTAWSEIDLGPGILDKLEQQS